MATAAAQYPLIREFSTTAEYTVSFRSPAYALGYGNTNVLARGDKWDVRLSKTGFINEAGRCLIMIATVGERAVTMVLLDSFGTRSPVGDATRVKRWLETGSIDGDQVHTPGIFVKRILQGQNYLKSIEKRTTRHG